MIQVRAITAIARADFLERVRRYSFLLTLLFAMFLGYAAATGRIMIQLGGHRGVYTSAWVGALVALVTTCWVSLVGFYIVKGGIDRDRQTGVGQVLAATPLSKSTYALGKFLSNFAVLSSMVLVLAVAAVVIQISVHEDSHLDFFALLSPFVIIALPAMLLTAAVAILFETLPVLRGGTGNVVWFFVWAFLGVALAAVTGIEWLDPLGNMAMASSMKQGAWAHIPGYQGGFAFTIADKPVQVVQSFRWEGVPWTASQILLRLAWCGVAIVLVFLAAAVFDRFDSVGWFGRAQRKAAQAVSGVAFANGAAFENGAASARGVAAAPSGSFARSGSAKIAPSQLTVLAARDRSNAFGRLFVAEWKLAMKGLRWWWYAVAAGLLVAQATAPIATARQQLLGTSWLWLVLVWSAMGARETRFGTRALLFSSARILPRQILTCWLAGFALAVLFGSAAGLRILATQGASALLPWIAGAAFLPSMALALGVWSGTSKPFEGILTAMWYIGPINRVSGIDYTGSSNGPATMHYALTYLIAAAALLIAAAALRGRQIRAN
ncbi:MAG TPA: hypothetical protein VMP12_05190 [Candidatus Sulfotelmatobacter sp.]|nr:hypothetical protein [Candidatus Sulfotelmatobacter sp.]